MAMWERCWLCHKGRETTCQIQRLMQVLGQESLAFSASLLATGASFILTMLCTDIGKAYLGWLDPNILIQFRMRERQLNSLLDFNDLLLQSSNICIRLQGCLLHLWQNDD